MAIDSSVEMQKHLILLWSPVAAHSTSLSQLGVLLLPSIRFPKWFVHTHFTSPETLCNSPAKALTGNSWPRATLCFQTRNSQLKLNLYCCEEVEVSFCTVAVLMKSRKDVCQFQSLWLTLEPFFFFNLNDYCY